MGKRRKPLPGLGEEGDSSALAFDFLKYIAINLAPLTDAEEIRREMQRLPPASSLKWKAVALLLHRPWFSRLWVLQKVTVSSDSHLLAGQSMLPWDQFSQAITALENTQSFDALKI
jgi:hypothetical protein